MTDASGALRVALSRVGLVRFEAHNARGGITHVEGSDALRARVVERASRPGRSPLPAEQPPTGTFRPMELFLVSLAGCSAMDVVLILERQRQPLGRLSIDVLGFRQEAVPAVFGRVQLRFKASLDVDPKKLERAVALSVDKYCSVRAMLGPGVAVGYGVERD